MNGFPVLTVLILVPLLGSIAAFVTKGELAKRIALAASLVALVLGLVVTVAYKTTGGMQFTEDVTWIKALGVHYALGLDGLGLMMVLLTLVVVPVVLVASWHDAETHPSGFFGWALALEALSLAVFMATDVFLFYVVFEATLIPAYFLIAGFGLPGRSRAAVKFLIYQLAGGLVMLASVIGLYVESAKAGPASYLLSDLAKLNIDSGAQKWIFIGFFIAFAIKAPMFPVHTWLADTAEKALPGTAVLLVCILDKIGTFGMLRFCLGLLPDASTWATPVVVVLALISIVYGAFVAIGQDNILRLVALTSLSHFGFIVLGIFVFSSQGISGSILYMVNHGIGTALLFLMAGYLIKRSGTPLISLMGGFEKVVPVLAGLTLIGGLAACGLPGLSPFISELLVIVAAFHHAWWAGAVAVTAIVLAAIYALWMYQRTMTGPTAPALETARDLTRLEVAAVAPLVALLIVFGFYPSPLLNVINPNVKDTLTHVGVTDKAPTAVAQEAAH